MASRIHWFFGLTLILVQLAGCQRRVPFNLALTGRFFPLRDGLTWYYRVTFANGATETITDRVVESDQPVTRGRAALVVSDYSGFEGNQTVRTDLSKLYPAQQARIETRYVLERGYITRITDLGGGLKIQIVEGGFLPRYVRPESQWSSNTHFDILKISQNHRSFLEDHEVVTPAGRFFRCIRIETEVSYDSLSLVGGEGEIPDKRYFTDWYAPDVGLVKTLVLSGGQDGREMARIELLRFAKSSATPAAPPAER